MFWKIRRTRLLIEKYWVFSYLLRLLLYFKSTYNLIWENTFLKWVRGR